MNTETISNGTCVVLVLSFIKGIRSIQAAVI